MQFMLFIQALNGLKCLLIASMQASIVMLSIPIFENWFVLLENENININNQYYNNKLYLLSIFTIIMFSPSQRILETCLKCINKLFSWLLSYVKSATSI